MIRLPTVQPEAAVLERLQTWQDGVNAKPDYPAQVQDAKDQFSRRNTRRNTTFRAVKVALTEMCTTGRRCCYCEGSVADEVEHIQPKDLYPEAVFSWNNYVYACGPCNGPKNNQFTVIDGGGQLVEVNLERVDPPVPPAAGASALINPRLEDPLELLRLDLLDTFGISARPDLSAIDSLRADYTVRVLQMATRDEINELRAEAYSDFLAHLELYVRKKTDGEPAAALERHQRSIQEHGHPTVWQEMKRQSEQIPELAALFDQAPEALTW